MSEKKNKPSFTQRAKDKVTTTAKNKVDDTVENIKENSKTVQDIKRTKEFSKKLAQIGRNIVQAIINFFTFLITPAGWLVIGIIAISFILMASLQIMGKPVFDSYCNVLNENGEWEKVICKTQGDGGGEGRIKSDVPNQSKGGAVQGNSNAESGTLGEFTAEQIAELNTRTLPSYPKNQCTWGAKLLAPWAGDYWGNGGQWGISAERAGFKTGKTPEVGALISFDDGSYGHIAYVIAVRSETEIQILEANYGGTAYGADPRGIGNYRGWFNPLATGMKITYIYNR